jgi:anti-sigma factor RsiW
MNSHVEHQGVREDAELDAYRDGELSLWRRWLVGRRVARDPALQRRLAALETLGSLLREQAESTPQPDFWDGIRARLATAPRPEPLHETSLTAPATSAAPAWLGAAFATAVVVFVMATSWLPGDAPSGASVRWLDSKGKPVMVLRDDLEATIIWVIQKPKRTTGGGIDAML